MSGKSIQPTAKSAADDDIVGTRDNPLTGLISPNFCGRGSMGRLKNPSIPFLLKHHDTVSNFNVRLQTAAYRKGD